MKVAPLLRDLLAPDLKIVFCGTAASEVSAARGEYYAGPGNKFWSILHEIGLTPRLLAPAEYGDLLGLGIGLTDVVKDQAGGDADIDFVRSDPDGLCRKITRFAPGILAFNGKRAAQVFLKLRRVEYGVQTLQVGETRLFVAPSTSGAANGYWDASIWCGLSELVRRTSA
ncbi:MAG: mismatch-specific DNA-glycosylase [bacterium]|nr:mismatch-specific DNA-glycosylase [bacterium]